MLPPHQIIRLGYLRGTYTRAPYTRTRFSSAVLLLGTLSDWAHSIDSPLQSKCNFCSSFVREDTPTRNAQNFELFSEEFLGRDTLCWDPVYFERNEKLMISHTLWNRGGLIRLFGIFWQLQLTVNNSVFVLLFIWFILINAVYLRHGNVQFTVNGMTLKR